MLEPSITPRPLPPLSAHSEARLPARTRVLRGFLGAVAHGTVDAFNRFMFEGVRKKWNQLKEAPPGERFQQFHESERQRPAWVRFLYLGLAILFIPVGVLFAFIPGPAVLFFALSAGLFAAQSMWVAKRLDRLEVVMRSAIERLRAAYRRRHPAH